MSIANLTGTILFCTAEKAELTTELDNIMSQITTATKKNSTVNNQNQQKRDSVKEQYEPDTTEYKTAMDDINQDYLLQTAEINAWESELDQQKVSIETKLKVVTAYQESFEGEVKQNVKKDFSYGSN